ncbi:hypothetical protein EON81_05550 [bacterium]|nr:MAG: hypothetical protein EON81_05550 [bacterium]
MKNLLKYAALAVLTVTAVSAMAQQQGGGGGGNRQGGGQRGGGMQRMMRGGGMMGSLQLVQRDDVREDLVLTDEQKDKLSDLQKGQRDKMREAFQGMAPAGGGGGTPPDMTAIRAKMEAMTKESDAEVAKNLTAEQSKRLREIKIQMTGNRAVAMDDVATELGLTTEQKAKVKKLSADADAANMTLFGKIRSQEMTMEQVTAAVETNGKTLDTEIEKTLTEAQRTKFKEMAGKKFEEKDRPRGGGGFGGGGRN